MVLSTNVFARDCLKDYHRLHLTNKVLGKIRHIYDANGYEAAKVKKACQGSTDMSILVDEVYESDMSALIMNKELDRDGVLDADNLKNKYNKGRTRLTHEDVCEIYEKTREEFNHDELDFFDAKIRSTRLDESELIRICESGALKSNNYFRH